MITTEKRGHITIVTIDRPERRNALDAEAQAELNAIFDAFEADDDQRVAIVTGAGDKAFCAGHDLSTPAPECPDDMPRGGFGGLTARFAMRKPVIAAVNGFAVGGGFEMVLACDIVVAAPHARFALPEVRVGMMPLAGGILRLYRLAGHHRAMTMLLTGRMIEMAEAEGIGLVAEVAHSRPVLDYALEWATRILEASPLAVQATKAVATRFADQPLGSAMDAQWTLPEVIRAQQSQDAAEGPAAFIEHRKPHWRGC